MTNLEMKKKNLLKLDIEVNFHILVEFCAFLKLF